MDIVDVRIVWQAGLQGVRVSKDGALTWEETNAEFRNENDPCFLSFLDAETGWIGTLYKLRSTSDGGMTWAEIKLPEGIKDIAAISLQAPGEGYVLDNGGLLYFTQNGGKNWSSRTLDLEDVEALELGTNAAIRLLAVRFFDADLGLVILSLAGGGKTKVLALRTTDGGQTWEKESIPAEFGAPYLTRDGKLLTISAVMGPSNITVLRYQEQ